ncbi:hypothetical protein A2696_01235 [Candidatus Curtissbacteria bacterium RIFCSPHIGHO2_01_FULL_41_13]|uniref:Uncharacterized protein n=1 Tax=Candidatus Curtissbacteria bacterium RIFCSPHIGHO2_01_FULL_41_13 TaxID=1797745 RepID=A0A1F5G087_9BACT|nr:MAG: hypothetical protein A2696_01235 [Candidatus Curtissbacteria bacterium RIFCSPHIGHO2_01_FULL_41_13]
MAAKWMVVHAHYKGESPKRSDSEANFAEKEKVYRCGKCKKVVAGVEQGRRNKLYVLAKDVVVDVE